MGWLEDIWRDVRNTDLALEELKVDAAKKEVLSATAEREARVAQEIAIAQRITSALEVNIEEFYEYKGEGAAGFSSDASKVNLGVSGSGQRVTKRIYTFKGFADSTAEPPPSSTPPSKQKSPASSLTGAAGAPRLSTK